MAPSIPSSAELHSLTEAYRRDPAGSFVKLGYCYLALGRPGDAVEVGTGGLRANPDDLEGRLMVGIAFSQLHRWKEAQAELLKVVKADRNNARGFRLLGEVLMRRSDFERALPVLQHAQNLNPSDPEVLALVRRARDGHPPEPPPPIPVAIAPVQAAMGGFEGEDVATRIVPGRGGPPAPPSLGRMDLQQREVSMPAPDDRMAMSRSDDRSNDAPAFAPIQMHQAPRAENPLAPLGDSGPVQAPTPQAPAVRPRIIPTEKPKDAAQEGLRTSAAMGEQYLNQLLLNGLLDVPNVRANEVSYDATPGNRWGRSAARMFIYLFALLIAAGAGSGAWYWYAKKQVAADVARHLDTAKGLVGGGAQDELSKAAEEAQKAIKRDPADMYATAVLAEVSSLSTLLYGEFEPAQVERAIAAVEQEVKEPSDPGYRELVIAKAATALAALSDMEAGADESLQTLHANLKTWRENNSDDMLALWLIGRAQLAAGDRKGAMATFKEAHADGAGPAIATVDLADMHLDEGDYEGAIELYDDALSRSPNHALAFVGRSLARSERRVEAQEAMSDLSIGLAQAKGGALLAWKELAMAYAQASLGDYEAHSAALEKATGPQEPRFLARRGLLLVGQGAIVDAARVRGDIRWYAADPQPHPLVQALDAELLLARGLPKEAIEVIGEQKGVRANSIRGRAHFDLGEVDEAMASFDAALKVAPDNLDLQAWYEASRMIAKSGSERRKADEALDSLGRKATTKTARFVHGTALAAVGKAELARDKLEQSVTDVSTAFPNPLEYRSHLQLARLDVAADKPKDAAKHLEQAAEHNPGYLPTQDLLGQVLVDSAPDEALAALADVISTGTQSVAAEVAFARALGKTGGSKDDAIAALKRAKERGADAALLQKAIPDIDTALFEELGVEPPKE